MSDVKWIKMSVELFDNRKIRQIESLPEGDSIIVIWMKLLCLAGNINDSGMVYFTKEIPYTEQMLATQFNRPMPTVQLALSTFQQFGMIDIIDDIVYISNWEKYQNVEGMELIREQTRKRVAKHRANQKKLEGNVTCNVTVTQRNATDIDIDKDKEIDRDIDNNNSAPVSAKNHRFIPPTVDEVRAYIAEKGFQNVNAEAFVDFYESKGWYVGKNKMQKWKAAVSNWERNDANARAGSGKQKTADMLNDSYRMYAEWAEEES